jgi:hypothetical protein
MAPADRLTGPAARPVAQRSDRIDVTPGLAGRGVTDRPGQRFMDVLRQDLFAGLQRLQPFANGLQGFFQKLFTTGNLGGSIREFGQEILSGMGSIFATMAAKAIAAAPLFIAIGKAMSNPFTAGFALLAFGIALKALGASMGGSASGGGGAGGGAGGFDDRTTRITLSADGAGGRNAPGRPDERFTVLGVDSPKGQRVLATAMKGAKRRGM